MLQSLLQVVLEWIQRVPKHRASQGMTGAPGNLLRLPAVHFPEILSNVVGEKKPGSPSLTGEFV